MPAAGEKVGRGGEGGERRGGRGLGRVKKREKVIFGRGGNVDVHM